MENEQPAAEKAVTGATGEAPAAQPEASSKWAPFVAEMDKNRIEPDKAVAWVQQARYTFETEKGRQELYDNALAGRENEIGKKWFVDNLAKSKSRRFLEHVFNQYREQHGQPQPAVAAPPPESEEAEIDDPYLSNGQPAPNQAPAATALDANTRDLLESLQAEIKALKEGQAETSNGLTQTRTALIRAEQFKHVAESIGVSDEAYPQWAAAVANKLDSGLPQFTDDGSGNVARVAGEEVLKEWRHRGTLVGLAEPPDAVGSLSGPSAAVLKDLSLDSIGKMVKERDATGLAEAWVTLEEAEGAF